MARLARIDNQNLPLLGVGDIGSSGLALLCEIGGQHDMPGVGAAVRIADGNDIAGPNVIDALNESETFLRCDGVVVGDGEGPLFAEPPGEIICAEAIGAFE
ncbi:MAG: hypothetical protein U1F68_12860 [Gammaproteobacteria bacterium]